MPKTLKFTPRMAKLIIAEISPRLFRYLAAALVLSIVFTLVTSSSLKNARQYGVGLSFIVVFCYSVWLLSHFLRTSLSVLIAWIGFSSFPVIRQSFAGDRPSIKGRLAMLAFSAALCAVMAIVLYVALIFHHG